MLEVRDLRLLTTIAAHGSLVRAARVLGLTQSGLTRALAALETRLHAPLFDRSRRGLEPTQACRAILALSGEILGKVEALDQAVAGLRDDAADTLGLAAGPFALETVVTAAAAALLVAQPQTRLRIEGGMAIDAVRDLRDRRAELAVAEISELAEPEAFVIEPLRRHPILLLVRPGHPLLRLGRPPSMADVLGYPAATTTVVASRVGLQIAAARQGTATTTPHPVFPAVVAESLAACLAVAAGSEAVAAATAPAARLALEAGSLALLPLQPAWLVTNFGVLSLRKRPLSAAAEAMVAALRMADAEAEAVAARLLSGVDLAVQRGAPAAA